MKNVVNASLFTSLTCLILILQPVFGSSQKDDFTIVKERVIAELMKTSIVDTQVTSILTRMNEDGSFNDINYDDLSRTAGFPHRRHTYDLVYAAKAYKKEGSKYYQDRNLKERIVISLKYWVDHDYFGDNWHNNQISTPTNLVNLMLVMGEEFPKDLVDKAQPIIGRAHMNASGARPSGDRIVIAGILAKNLLFIGDKNKFDEIIRLIEGEVKFSTGKRGMQHDYSFHHRTDRVNNTTSYGYGKYANAFGEWSYYVANTKYEFSIEKINHLVDYYLDGVYKQLVYGVYTDISVKNRSIAHKTTFEPRGTTEIERLLFSTDYRKDELEEILHLREGKAKPSQSFCKFFWQTEHFVCQRPNFYTTVRMYSTRNQNMEVPYNGPGITTHHRADGTNYLMLKGDEYHNIWPVYDWQKISGTTIMQKPVLHGPENIRLEGLTDFVGAVTDGMYGAVAFDFISAHDMTHAKKSWFFFDDKYVCIGTDIASRPNLPVFTTVDQVLMRNEISIHQAGETKILPRGSHQLNNIKWVLHDRVGYVFPTATTIHVSNQAEQGRWSDITLQKNISKEVVTKDVFALWFDHGQSPDDGSYQYMVIPDISKEELEHSSQNNGNLEILSNTGDLQAVMSHDLNIAQMAFYQAGSIDLTNQLTINLNSQGMMMVELENSRIAKMTLADPSRKLNKMVVTISGKYEGQGDHFVTFPDQNPEHTLIIVDLPQGVYAGKSVEIEL